MVVLELVRVTEHQHGYLLGCEEVLVGPRVLPGTSSTWDLPVTLDGVEVSVVEHPILQLDPLQWTNHHHPPHCFEPMVDELDACHVLERPLFLYWSDQ